MVIDQEKLIALLVEKTGQSQEEVTRQLRRLAEKVQAAAQSGDTYEIPHFGVFSAHDGGLHFEPSEQLKTEINQKYAGMQPIELMEAFKESGAGVPVEEVSSPKREKPTEPTSAESPEGEKDVQPKKQSPDQPAVEKEKAVPVSASAGESTRNKYEKDPDDEETPHDVHPSFRKRSNQGNRLAGLLVAIVMGIVILAGGWFLYDSGVLQNGTNDSGSRAPADTSARTSNPQRGAVVEDEAVNRAQSGADSTEQNRGGVVSTNSTADSSQAASKYGLGGSMNSQVKNAYTIVIHSFHLKSTVQEIADSLSREGYRTVLFQGGGPNSRWRLGLGQFETKENAQKAVQTLTEPYKENNFITPVN